MAVNIDSQRSFRIVSRSDINLPIGVNPTQPPFQPVYVDAPVNSWRFKQVGLDEYLLSVGPYPYTGVIHDRVTASIYQGIEWKITFQAFQAAYTIARADDPSLGWTLNQESGQVEIRLITESRSLPPQFRPVQLFVFEPLLEE